MWRQQLSGVNFIFLLYIGLQYMYCLLYTSSQWTLFPFSFGIWFLCLVCSDVFIIKWRSWSLILFSHSLFHPKNTCCGVICIVRKNTDIKHAFICVWSLHLVHTETTSISKSDGYENVMEFFCFVFLCKKLSFCHPMMFGIEKVKDFVLVFLFQVSPIQRNPPMIVSQNFLLLSWDFSPGAVSDPKSWGQIFPDDWWSLIFTTCSRMHVIQTVFAQMYFMLNCGVFYFCSQFCKSATHQASYLNCCILV